MLILDYKPVPSPPQTKLKHFRNFEYSLFQVLVKIQSSSPTKRVEVTQICSDSPVILQSVFVEAASVRWEEECQLTVLSELRRGHEIPVQGATCMKLIDSDTLCSCPKVSLIGRLKTLRKAFPFVVPRLVLYYVGHFYIILDSLPYSI